MEAGMPSGGITMKKSLLLLIALILFVTPLFAQGSQEAQGPITLQFWTHEDPNRTRIEDRYIHVTFNRFYTINSFKSE